MARIETWWPSLGSFLDKLGSLFRFLSLSFSPHFRPPPSLALSHFAFSQFLLPSQNQLQPSSSFWFILFLVSFSSPWFLFLFLSPLIFENLLFVADLVLFDVVSLFPLLLSSFRFLWLWWVVMMELLEQACWWPLSVFEKLSSSPSLCCLNSFKVRREDGFCGF